MTTLAVVELEHVSGLPRDRMVNTFHFGQTFAPFVELTPTQLDLVGLAINDFYQSAAPGALGAIGQYLGGQLSRAIIPEIKFYRGVRGHEGPVPPEDETGPAYATRSFLAALPAPLSALELPSEVAVCVSYHAAPAAGIDPRRLRGRIYVGPLNSAAQEDPGAAFAIRPAAQFMTDLTAAAAELQADTDDVPATSWVVFSRGPFKVGTSQDPVARPIVGGHVDNAFDTQRRRGETATSRQVWGV